MADLERDLRSLAHAIDWPDVDVASSAGAELRAGRTADRPLPRLSLWPRRKVIALAVAALLLVAGTAVAARLALGSITIHVVQRLPSPASSARPSPSSILGRAASADEAASLVRVPAHTALGAPDGAFVGHSPAGRMASVTWNAQAGEPHLDGTGFRAILIAFRGTDAVAATKEVLPRTTLVPVRVDTSPGYWIEGPHQLVLQGGRLRLGGGVLIWTRNGITYRLESTLSKAEALAVARAIE